MDPDYYNDLPLEILKSYKFREVPDCNWTDSPVDDYNCLILKGYDIKGVITTKGKYFLAPRGDTLENQKRTFIEVVEWMKSVVSLQWYYAIVVKNMMRLERFKCIPEDLEREIVRYLSE